MAAKPTQFKPVVPVPEGTPAPPQRHPHRGEPARRFPYYLADGDFAGWSCEFPDSSGQPVTLPLTWTQDTHPPHDLMWRWQALPEPRPLYGLLDLSGCRVLDSGYSLPTLIFPTEAEADQAREALTGLVLDGETVSIPCLSWFGGPNCAMKNDWTPINGRPVWIWPGYSCQRKRLSPFEAESGELPESQPFLPDKRQPGLVAAAKIAEVLTQQGCTVMVLSLPEIGAYREGWGVADVIATDGLTGQNLFDFIRTRLNPFSPAKFGTDKAVKRADLPEGLSTPQQACALPLENAAHTDAQAGANPACAGSVEAGPIDWSWTLQLKGGRDNPLDCRENVNRFLLHHPVLKGVVFADEFSRNIVMRKPAPWVIENGFEERPWSLTDSYELGDWLSQNANLLCRGIEPITQAVSWCASLNRYTPPAEYGDSLVWDGIERLKSWTHVYLGSELNEYSSLIGSIWFIGMAARIYKPGCINRFMIILEGEQFRGKSAALRAIGGKWFRDTVLDHRNKDQYLNWQGCLIYEIAELDSFNRAESTTMKAIVSSPSDFFRAPYEARPMDYPRTVVFAGTTNQNAYFKDSTGNTRYWPIKTSIIKLEELIAIRDQLFAEAVHYYKQGTDWWPSYKQQTLLLSPEQNEREIIDPWEEIIENYVIGKAFITIKDILINASCLNIDAGKIDASRSMAMRVGSILQRLGWKRVRTSADGKRQYHYQSPDNKGNYDAF
ncbi:MAG: VapE domain-containing protein [Nitrosomonadales bacterium]